MPAVVVSRLVSAWLLVAPVVLVVSPLLASGVQLMVLVFWTLLEVKAHLQLAHMAFGRALLIVIYSFSGLLLDAFA